MQKSIDVLVEGVKEIENPSVTSNIQFYLIFFTLLIGLIALVYLIGKSYEQKYELDNWFQGLAKSMEAFIDHHERNASPNFKFLLSDAECIQLEKFLTPLIMPTYIQNQTVNGIFSVTYHHAGIKDSYKCPPRNIKCKKTLILTIRQFYRQNKNVSILPYISILNECEFCFFIAVNSYGERILRPLLNEQERELAE